MTARDPEETSLLLESNADGGQSLAPAERNKLSHRILPVAFFAAFGTSSTAATTVSAYAYLCCDNPLHCNEQEHQAYARTVALGTVIANICGILALGPVAHFSTKHRSWGLLIWFLSRGMSIVLLLVAGKRSTVFWNFFPLLPMLIHTVAHKNVLLALVGRVFEGAATDNILHYNLNAIYVESSPESDTSRLLGLSLGFYMVGLAVGPPMAGLLKEFTWSFYLAIVVFLLSIFYVHSFIPWKYHCQRKDDIQPASNRSGDLLSFKKMTRGLTGIFSLSNPFLSPLSLFYKDKVAVLYGLALLNFTSGQAYFFPALLIHTSTKFGFTSQQVSQHLIIITSSWLNLR